MYPLLKGRPTFTLVIMFISLLRAFVEDFHERLNFFASFFVTATKKKIELYQNGMRN